jgi:curved DNA-binding protein CbpA
MQSSSQRPCYYEILGVAREASQDEIKKVFRRLAYEYHPDTAKDKKRGEEKFKEINNAYEILGDIEKRKRYDEIGSSWQDFAQFREWSWATGPRSRVDPEELDPFQRAGIDLFHGFISVKNPAFQGEFCRSKNDRYILGWCDAIYTRDDAHPERTPLVRASGKYILIDGTKVILQGALGRPSNGRVSNFGDFIFNDRMHPVSDMTTDRRNLRGTFYAFSASGKVLIQQRFEAFLGANGLSDDGRMAACGPLSGFDEEFDKKVCLFDLEKRKMIIKFKPECINIYGKNIDRYEFDQSNKILKFVNRDGLSHRYNFEGKFLDAETWKTQRLNYASVYMLLVYAEEDLRAISGNDLAAFSDVIRILELALAKGIPQISKAFTEAKIHRNLGEIYYRCGKTAKAISHLQSALRLYPKIGVKKLLAKIENMEGSGH